MWFRKKPVEIPWTPAEQLGALPLRNVKAAVISDSPQRRVIQVALIHRGLVRWFRGLLHLRSQRIWELTELDLLLHDWCDGKTTVGQMVERIHRDEHLPWNEARQVVLSYLPRLVSRGIIVVGKPA
jgi:hypothetical protein